MPETPTTYNYYPSLSELITTDDLPDILGFIKEGLQQIFEKIYYKDFQSSRSISSSAAFYSLSIVSRTKLAVEFPGTGIYLVLNPDYEDSTISSFPITVFWQWEIMRYLRYFNANQFSFSPEGFYDLTLQVLNVSEEQVLVLAMNTFVVNDPGVSKFQQLINDINLLYGSSIAIDESSETRFQELIIGINAIGEEVYPTIFTLYLASDDLNESKEKLNYFFSTFIPYDVETYIKNIITPKARVTLALSAALEFPPNILKPVLADGTPIENTTTKFLFAHALLYADTEAGIGYQLELAGSLVPTFATIGNTGLILQIQSLKIDLSKKSNIPEADWDGRDNDFIGVYARAVSVTFPPQWFHDDDQQPVSSTTTLRLGGYDLLVGTGGVSGTIMLESVPIVIPGVSFEYYNDKFTFDYPITMFGEDPESSEIIEININDYLELKSCLQELNAISSAPYPFKFPLSLKPIGMSTSLVFDNAPSYQYYLAGLNNNTLWKRIGGVSPNWIAFGTPTIEDAVSTGYKSAVFPHTITVNQEELEVKLELV